MKTIVNVGLSRNDGGPDNGVLHVVATLNSYHFVITAADIHEVMVGDSDLDTIRTLVASVVYRGFAIERDSLHVCDALGIDYIAFATIDDFGKVVTGDEFGSEIGSFDPDNFVFLQA